MIGKYKIIGVCLSRIQEEDRLNCIKPLNEYACAHGYRLLIFNAFEDLYLQDNINQIGEGAVFQLIQYEMLDALILFGETIKKQEIRDMIQENCRRYQVPLLCIDLYMKGAVNFSFDYANTFEALCRHVIKDHHAKRIFMMAGLQENRFSQERVQVFRKVMQEERLPVSEGDIAYGDFWDQPTLHALEEWFTVQKRDIPDAIVCANDTVAIVVSKYLQDRGYRVPEDCRGKDLRIVIISADLDGLKTINDTYGHTEGDNAIKTVGRVLMASAIQGEVCARFGGDEFSVAGIISERYSSYYESFQRRFRDYLHQYNQVSNKPYLVESSIGFCMEPYTEDISLDNLIKIADANMYQDKIARKNAPAKEQEVDVWIRIRQYRSRIRKPDWGRLHNLKQILQNMHTTKSV